MRQITYLFQLGHRNNRDRVRYQKLKVQGLVSSSTKQKAHENLDLELIGNYQIA